VYLASSSTARTNPGGTPQLLPVSRASHVSRLAKVVHSCPRSTLAAPDRARMPTLILCPSTTMRKPRSGSSSPASCAPRSSPGNCRRAGSCRRRPRSCRSMAWRGGLSARRSTRWFKKAWSTASRDAAPSCAGSTRASRCLDHAQCVPKRRRGNSRTVAFAQFRRPAETCWRLGLIIRRSWVRAPLAPLLSQMLHQVSLESLASRWLTVQSLADPSAAPVQLARRSRGQSALSRRCSEQGRPEQGLRHHGDAPGGRLLRPGCNGTANYSVRCSPLLVSPQPHSVVAWARRSRSP
jgi:hypothetical protein